VTNSTQYVFKPKPEICDWIDENIPSWTTHCYDSIYRLQKKDHHEYRKKIGIGIGTILFGMIFLSLSYLTVFLFLYLSLIAMGIFLVVIGFYNVGWEVRNGRTRG